jgi:hypothetical protein
MFVTVLIVCSGLFALITKDASLHGGRELIARRPYENVRDGMPRSARSTTHLDL